MIRLANKYDNNKIIELIKDFAVKSNNSITYNPLTWSKTYVEQILATLYAGQGFVLIDDKQTGILIAAKTECFWLKNVFQLQEVMLHGKNKFVIVKLIKEYVKIAKQMLSENQIQQAVISSENNVKFEKYGMVKFEEHWEIK